MRVLCPVLWPCVLCPHTQGVLCQLYPVLCVLDILPYVLCPLPLVLTLSCVFPHWLCPLPPLVMTVSLQEAVLSLQ